MKKHTVRALSIAVAGLLTLTGCGTTAIDAAEIPDQPADGGILQYGTDIQPLAGGLDPYVSQGFAAQNFWVHTYEPLLTKDAEGGIQPGLAESWEQPDPTTYLFHLREGIRFSNGEPLTVEDVVFSLETMAETGLTQKPLMGNLESVEAVDEDTVKASLSSPGGPFLNVVSSRAIGSIVDKEWYTTTPAPERERTMLGTGPFELVNWENNVVLQMRRNEHYWDPELPHLDGIDFRILPDEQARLAAMRQGSVEAIWLGDAQLAEQVEGEGFEIGQNAATRTMNIYIDSTTGPMAEPAVRQAVSKGIDREKIALLASYGYGEPTTAVPVGDPEGTPPTADTPNYAYDPEGARRLLEEAGHADGVDIVLTYASDPTFARDVALYEVMKEQLKSVGVNLVLQPLPWADVLNRYLAGKFDGLIAVPGTAQPDVSGYFAPYITPGMPTNTTGEHGQTAARLLAELNAAPDPEARKRAQTALEEEIAEEVLILFPYVVTQRQELWSPRLQGYEPDPYSYRENLRKGWLVP